MLFTCYASQKYNSQTFDKYHFIIDDFEKERGKTNSFQYEENDSIVIKQKSNYGFQIIKYPKQKINLKKMYSYNQKGLLIIESSFFGNLPINIRRLYDGKRNIVYIEDFTRPQNKYKLENLLKNHSKNGNNLYNRPVEIIPATLGKDKNYWIIVRTGYIDDIGGTQAYREYVDANKE